MSEDVNLPVHLNKTLTIVWGGKMQGTKLDPGKARQRERQRETHCTLIIRPKI